MAESGVIFDIKQYAIHDGPGIRTTVFFKGCPLDCAWCHNPESRCPDPETLPGIRPRIFACLTSGHDSTVGCSVTVEKVMTELLRDEIFYDQSGGGVTFSGGEPLLQIDFLTSLLDRCRQSGLHTAVDTSGYAESDSIRAMAELADLVLFDLKLMDESLHTAYTGVSNRPILSNLKMLAASGRSLVIRMPLIPGITDTPENVDAVSAFLLTLPSIKRIDLLPYNRLGEDKLSRFGMKQALPAMPEQDPETVTGIRDRFMNDGFDIQIGG